MADTWGTDDGVISDWNYHWDVASEVTPTPIPALITTQPAQIVLTTAIFPVALSVTVVRNAKINLRWKVLTVAGNDTATRTAQIIRDDVTDAGAVTESIAATRDALIIAYQVFVATKLGPITTVNNASVELPNPLALEAIGPLMIPRPCEIYRRAIYVAKTTKVGPMTVVNPDVNWRRVIETQEIEELYISPDTKIDLRTVVLAGPVGPIATRPGTVNRAEFVYAVPALSETVSGARSATIKTDWAVLTGPVALAGPRDAQADAQYHVLATKTGGLSTRAAAPVAYIFSGYTVLATRVSGLSTEGAYILHGDLPETPEERIIRIPGEDRVIHVILEPPRVVRIPGEDRVVRLGEEDRVVTLPEEDRTISILGDIEDE